MKQVLASPWGRLFQNWERLTSDADGFPDVGDEPATAPRARHARRSAQSVGILGTCIKEAPEFASRRRRHGRRRVRRREDFQWLISTSAPSRSTSSRS